mmetsp:Transcript_196/g.608  ORF Transcript_196/g.608 Transcript_196/m.608 type:complete len:557 (+) Transcript_196:76-1746(+)
MVARRTSSAGFVAGARPDGVSGFVRRADFYAKLPSELAEGSVIGGLVSIICTMAFVWLFVAQFKSYNTVGTRTDIVVDHEADKSFQVNFKIELPELSCEWATVDVVDSLGARRFNISGEQLYKHALGSDHYLGVEHASVTAGNSGYEVDTDGTDVDHYGNARIAYEITGATFERMVKAHRVLLINFHAPWCSHCQALAPVFEHAAELVRDDLKEHKKQRLAAGVATVDCTLDRNKKLCAAQQIQAFPSLRLYRAGESYGVKQPNASSKGKAAGKGQLQFEAYHGDRSAEAIAAYVHEALDETLHEADAKHESSYDDDEGKARAASATKKAAVAAGARKALGGTARTSGCVIDGSVRVNRVPGALYVTPHSIGHAINSELVNMTHVIKHLSFGKHVPGGKPSFVPKQLRNTWRRVPRDMGGRFASKDLSASVQNTFVSDHPFTVHEHHLNVVGRTFEPLDGPQNAVRLYEYTFNSNRFVLEPESIDSDDQRIDGAAVKFSFDISPMRVVSKETRKPLLDWSLGVCALVGGVYTCSGLLTAFLENGASAVKRRIGKHA